MPTEHLDVLIVGAGLSGIGAGHYIQTECPWATYAIFEARGSIGGTWDLFRYPGIRSDSDMYTLGYSFRPWNGEKAIADGDSILAYIEETAAEERIDDKIHFHHRIERADWSTDDACWSVTARRTDPDAGTDELVELTAGFIFSCAGYYRYDHGHQPDFPGRDRFQGEFIHPQAWPEDLEYAGKKVVVIGSGATAITLIPSMAEDTEHITMLQRSPSYILSVPAENPLTSLLRRLLPPKYSGTIMRWFMAIMTQGMYQVSQRFPNAVARLLKRGVRAQLPDDFDVDRHFTPTYDPWDQRLCIVPDGDLFRSIDKGQASIVTDHIDTITEHGIRVQSGEELEADIIVSATGLELLFLGGIEATVDGEKVDLPNKLTYKGMMIEDVPNLAVALGYTNASWTLKCELTCQYVTRLLNHLHETGLRQCTPVNDDPTITEEPLLNLDSGYIRRAAHELPKQGSDFPWQVHQSFLADHRAMQRSDIHDRAMRFTNPAPQRTPESV
ncbi:MAG: NAD(P)/FAD-dependent oxidoreductase [Acidimicrobiales bacterium]|nr:NAD(P)/FAD-dependent oxidoreductase [Acidimicrobiales bacterium]